MSDKLGVKFSVDTKIKCFEIEQDVYMHRYGTVEKISSQVIMLQEEGIRDALIKLGWTPPVEEDDKRESIKITTVSGEEFEVNSVSFSKDAEIKMDG